MGETVGLTPQQIFADTNCLVANPKLIEDMKIEAEALQLACDLLREENKELKKQVESLKDELLTLYRARSKKSRN